MSRRKGLLEELDKSIKRSFYRDRDDAIEFARGKAALYGGNESTDGDNDEPEIPAVHVQLRIAE